MWSSIARAPACACLLALVLLAACGGVVSRQSSAPVAAVATNRDVPPRPAALQYTFTLDAQLEQLDARMCVTGAPPRSLALGMPAAADLLQRVAIEGDGGVRELPFDVQPIPLPGMRDGDCVLYRMRLEEGASSGLALTRAHDALMTNTSLWLARPLEPSRFGEITARFELPAGMQVSVPWPQRGDRYVVEPSAFAFYAYAAFGRFERELIEAGGGHFELALMPGLDEAARPHLRAWITRAAEAVASLYGRVPRERIQLVVLPVSGSGPVRFGMITRGGGASIGVLLDRNFEPGALERDWVLVHEMCHLLHPFVQRGDAWLSEGIATYYQEVLRVRAGLLPERDAWRRILEGSRKGAGMKRSVAVEAADMYSTHAFAPVYWAGASFALLADVELRTRTQGRVSLDHVVEELSACCSRSLRPVAASEVIARMDAIAGTPVFSELMHEWVLGSHFPRLDALYARLGLDARGEPNAVATDGAAIREAIMRGARLQPTLADGTRAP